MKLNLKLAILVVSASVVFLGGCSSTQQRAGIIGASSAAGGALGYALGDKKPLAIAGGAVAGGVISALAMGEDQKVKQDGFDQGYVQGQSDAIKRQYWLRQAVEREKHTGDDEGQPAYYVVPGPEQTADGKKLEPHQVVVRVVE